MVNEKSMGLEPGITYTTVPPELRNQTENHWFNFSFLSPIDRRPRLINTLRTMESSSDGIRI